MKKIILSLSLTLTVTVTALLAAPPAPVPGPGAEESFKKEFAGAESVKWSEENGIQVASFVLGGHRTEAYFSSDGELLGSIRDLFYDQLPLAVMKAVDGKFPECDIENLREVANSDGVTYRMRIELKGKKYDLVLDTSGNYIEKKQLK